MIDWRGAFIWAAECHAATAEVALDRKRTSKSDLERHLMLCQSLLAMLEGAMPPPSSGDHKRDLESAAYRLRSCLKALESK